MLRLFIGTQIIDFVRQLAFDDLSIRRDQKPVVIDLSKNSETGNQSDIRTFRRLNRTDSAIVRNMYVANFETSSLSIQSARPQSRESPFMREHRQRIRLVDHLRQLTSPEKVLDRR